MCVRSHQTSRANWNKPSLALDFQSAVPFGTRSPVSAVASNVCLILSASLPGFSSFTPISSLNPIRQPSRVVIHSTSVLYRYMSAVAFTVCCAWCACAFGIILWSRRTAKTMSMMLTRLHTVVACRKRRNIAEHILGCVAHRKTRTV